MAKPLQVLVLLRNLTLGVMAPVLSLSLLAHGATLGTLSLLMAVYSATVILAEFPSGVFADLAGRKNAFLLSTVLQMLSYTLLLLARTAPVLGLAMVANGLGRAFASGSIDALAIDQAGEAALAKVTARLSMLESAGLAVGALLGGVLAGVGERYAANLTFNLGVYALLFGITLLAVREAPRPAVGNRPRREQLPAQVRESVALMRGKGLPRVLFGLALATGFALLAVETYWQPALEAFGPPAWSFGVVSFGSFFCVAVGSHLAERLLRRREGAGALWLLLLKALLGGLLCLLAMPGNAGGFIALYGVLYGAVGCGSVVENTLLNRITPSAQRASVLSLLSLMLQIGGLAASLCGYIIRAYGGYATLWRIAGGLLLAGAGAVLLHWRGKVPSGAKPPRKQVEPVICRRMGGWTRRKDGVRMTTTVLHVEGMSCGHCVKAVSGAVSALPGVKAVQVDLQAKTATVEHDPALVNVVKIREAIEGQGYDVVMD